MTTQEITEIYEYCIGGYNVPFSTMEKEVKKFLEEDRGNLKDEIRLLKDFEYRDLELTGMLDY